MLQSHVADDTTKTFNMNDVSNWLVSLLLVGTVPGLQTTTSVKQPLL